MMQRVGGLAIVALMVASGACAQDAPVPEAAAEVNAPASKNLWFVRVGYSPARVLTASQFVLGENVARTLTLELGRQTDGTRDWHRVYNWEFDRRLRPAWRAALRTVCDRREHRESYRDQRRPGRDRPP